MNPFKPLSDYICPFINSENVIISHEIKVYKDLRLDAFNYIVAKYPNLWKETGRVIDISEEYWMQVRFKDNWEVIGAKLNHKPYPVPANERAIIDETFNKLHEQGKIE